MFLYPKDHPIYSGHLKPFINEDIEKLRAKVKNVLMGEKYRKMAELAGV
jgi:hypothetical protein